MEDIKDQLFSTPILRVLDYLLENSGLEMSDAQVTAGVQGVKRAAVHQALTRLSRMGVVIRRHRDRRCYNMLDIGNSWLLYLKIASNILTLQTLVDELKADTQSIILFGSRAGGTNRHDSDFDLAIVCSDPEKILRIGGASDLSENLQFIIKTPEQMLGFESKEPALAARIRKGIVLWER